MLRPPRAGSQRRGPEVWFEEMMPKGCQSGRTTRCDLREAGFRPTSCLPTIRKLIGSPHAIASHVCTGTTAARGHLFCSSRRVFLVAVCFVFLTSRRPSFSRTSSACATSCKKALRDCMDRRAPRATRYWSPPLPRLRSQSASTICRCARVRWCAF
jgi:hypothetical protein